MQIFRQMKKSTQLLWIVILSVALLFAQGITFHLHGTVQEHNHSFEAEYHHTSIQEAPEHLHFSQPHSVIDSSHGDQHHDNTVEFDIKQDGLLNKLSISPILLGFLVVLLTLHVIINYVRSFCLYRDDDNVSLITCRFLFAPPLRAPPF